jgi:hypothetical protein
MKEGTTKKQIKEAKWDMKKTPKIIERIDKESNRKECKTIGE